MWCETQNLLNGWWILSCLGRYPKLHLTTTQASELVKWGVLGPKSRRTLLRVSIFAFPVLKKNQLGRLVGSPQVNHFWLSDPPMKLLRPEEVLGLALGCDCVAIADGCSFFYQTPFHPDIPLVYIEEPEEVPGFQVHDAGMEGGLRRWPNANLRSSLMACLIR